MEFKYLNLSNIFFLQDFGVNPEKYKFLGVNGHPGCDVSVGKSIELPLFASGMVVYANAAEGTVVVVDDTYEYSYAHLENIRVKVGDVINTGFIFASQGSTGATVSEVEYWSHLHFGVRRISSGRVPQKLVWDFPAFSPTHYHILNIDNGFEGYIDPKPLFKLIIERVATEQERFEGFPKKYNNPGALRWSVYENGSFNDGSGQPFSTFNTYELGRSAQLHQLTIAANGKSAYYKPWMTPMQFVKIYAPANDKNSLASQANYAYAINQKWGGHMNTLIGDWLLTEYEYVRKYQNSEPDGGIWVENPLARKINTLWSIVQGLKKLINLRK